MGLHSTLHRLITRAPFAPVQNMAGKTVLVTGCGPQSIGEATAIALAQQGAQVWITTRKHSEQAAHSIAHAAQVPASQVRGMDMDLLDYASVARAIATITQNTARLDVLINNAGIHLDLLRDHKTPQLTIDGHEIHWRCNYLGTAQLTQGLLPLLLKTAQKTGDARVVNIASQLHAKGQNLYLFAAQEAHDSWVSYGTSKLALLHHAFALQRRYAAQGLQAYALHPGAVFTRVADKGLQERPALSAMRRQFAWVESLFLLTPQEGAQTSLYCATAPALQGGRYFANCQPAICSADALDTRVSQRLYDRTQAWLTAQNSA